MIRDCLDPGPEKFAQVRLITTTRADTKTTIDGFMAPYSIRSDLLDAFSEAGSAWYSMYGETKTSGKDPTSRRNQLECRSLLEAIRVKLQDLRSQQDAAEQARILETLSF